MKALILLMLILTSCGGDDGGGGGAEATPTAPRCANSNYKGIWYNQTTGEVLSLDSNCYFQTYDYDGSCKYYGELLASGEGYYNYETGALTYVVSLNIINAIDSNSCWTTGEHICAFTDDSSNFSSLSISCGEGLSPIKFKKQVPF